MTKHNHSTVEIVLNPLFRTLSVQLSADKMGMKPNCICVGVCVCVSVGSVWTVLHITIEPIVVSDVVGNGDGDLRTDRKLDFDFDRVIDWILLTHPGHSCKCDLEPVTFTTSIDTFIHWFWNFLKVLWYRVSKIEPPSLRIREGGCQGCTLSRSNFFNFHAFGGWGILVGASIWQIPDPPMNVHYWADC